MWRGGWSSRCCPCCHQPTAVHSVVHSVVGTVQQTETAVSGDVISVQPGPSAQLLTTNSHQAPAAAAAAVAAPISCVVDHTETPLTTPVTTLHVAAITGNKAALDKLLSSTYSQHVDTLDKFGRTALVYSVLSDQADCVELLLKGGADINIKDASGRTALHWAAHKGHVNCAKLLLARGANWKEKDVEGQTSLHLCTRCKAAKCLPLLLKSIPAGAVDEQDNSKRTALHLAASFGNLEQLKLLIKQDSNIGIPDIEGKTPLHWAASCKDQQAVDCVQALLDTAPSVINWQDYDGCTALHLAVADGNLDIVRALIAVESCNVNALDNTFRTALHWAAVLGHSLIVELLLNNRADYSCSDCNGATALHYAALSNFTETVRVFLSHRTVKDEPDNDGRTALMWAASNAADDVVQCFISHGVDLLQMDKTGSTVLHAAAAAGHVSTVNLLLVAAGNQLLTATDLSKRSALSHACETGQIEVVKILIAAGAQLSNSQLDQDGQSLLHWAAVGGHAHICRLLLNYGINADIRDLTGRTALHCAAHSGNVNCMSVLLAQNADCNIQDTEGMTALHWACSKGHLDAVKLLVQSNAVINNMELTEDRYTPLDYALMAEHFQVAQYMIEHGAVSITGIQDLAAVKIQSWFRGYRVRKTFVERKKLLMKHEQLRKDAAAKKKADMEDLQRQINPTDSDS